MPDKKITPIMICSTCRLPYLLGINGTIEGCDSCTKTHRNPIDNTIITGELSGVLDDDDSLTDMEKA